MRTLHRGTLKQQEIAEMTENSLFAKMLSSSKEEDFEYNVLMELRLGFSLFWKYGNPKENAVTILRNVIKSLNGDFQKIIDNQPVNINIHDYEDLFINIFECYADEQEDC
jgi:hypothetical protein